MIYLKIEGHEFLYYIENILRMFYPETEVRICSNELPEDSRGIFVLSRLTFHDHQYQSIMSFTQEDLKKETRVMIAPEVGKNGKQSLDKKIKKAMQRQIYVMLQELSEKKMPWGILVGIRPTKIVSEWIQKGKEQNDIIQELQTSYYVSREKASLLYSVAKTEAVLLNRSTPDMISLYVGIPFCTSRCLYCSFTSNPIDKYRKLLNTYMEALEFEFNGVRKIIEKKNLKVQSIYIGGGTPTSIDPPHLEKLLSLIEQSMDLSHLEEYTLEAGRPDSFGRQKLEIIKASRVDRISINPQTMNNDTLKLIGRKHSGEQIVEAFHLARELGFENINMDLIAGLPGENPEIFRSTLEKIKALEPENLTIHTMSIKRASELGGNKQKYDRTSEAAVQEMVEMGGEYATAMGLHPYYLYRQKNILGNLENIGYCKPGFESVYNIQIMEEQQTILALGAGAVSKVVYPQENRLERAFNVKSVEEYLKRVHEMVERKKALLC